MTGSSTAERPAAAKRPLKVRLLGWLLLLVATVSGFVLPWFLTTLRPLLAVPIMVLASVVPVLFAMRMVRTRGATAFGAFALLFILPIVVVLLPMECDRVREMMRWERVDHGIRHVALACRMYANRNDGRLPPDLLTLVTSDLGSGTTSTSPSAPPQQKAAEVLLPRGMDYDEFLKLDRAERTVALERDPVFEYFGQGLREDAPTTGQIIILASREHMTNPRGSESGDDIDARRVLYADGRDGWIKRANWPAAWAKSEAARAQQK